MKGDLICWDSSVLIDWLKGDESDLSRMKDIKTVVESIGRGDCRLVVSTPDAVHVATAIVNKAKFFHTFDNTLLSLDGKNEVEGLKITPCHIQGTSAPLF